MCWARITTTEYSVLAPHSIALSHSSGRPNSPGLQVNSCRSTNRVPPARRIVLGTEIVPLWPVRFTGRLAFVTDSLLFTQQTSR